jgi:microcystin-dependent protein
VDAGRGLGSFQADDFKSHNHPPGNNRPGFMSNEYPVVQAYHGTNSSGTPSYSGEGQQMATTGVRGGIETRPRNVTVMWCIKAWNAPVNQGNIDVAALVKEVSRLGSAVPVGAVMAFPTGIVPPGFLELDGSVQSTATYPDLAAYIGSKFNKGDEGTGNFRLPESRGEFLRGWDHGRGIDAGRDIGSYQLGQNESHNHRYFDTARANIDPYGASALGVVNGVTQSIAEGGFLSSAGADNAQLVATTNTVNSGGSEARPRNLAVMWCIKAWNAPINQGNIDVAALAKEVEKLKSSVPVGAVLSFPTGVVPAGYLELDGSVQSTATYPDLAAYLGAKFNKGDEGTGNFRLPESRGEFLRGWDHGRGVDAGRAIGTYQKGSLLHGNDDTGAEVHGLNNINASRAGLGWDLPAMADYSGSSGYTSSGVQIPGSLFTQAHYGVARPRNLAVMWCIKAWNAPVNQGSIDVAALAVEARLARLNGAEVGAARNLRVSLPAAASVATLTADQLIVEQPGIAQYKLSDLNLSLDLTTVGVGGMDTGTAPVSGSVGIYVIYNPDLKVAKLLAVNATSSVIPEVYAGANMPVGYTASALVSVWQTNASRQLVPGIQLERSISVAQVTILENGVSMAWTALSLASVVPKNAKTVGGYVHYIASAVSTAGGNLSLASDATGMGAKNTGIGGALGLGTSAPFSDLVMITPQTIYYTLDTTVSRFNDVHITQYTF